MGTYDTGGVMRDIGCISSYDMTPAAAYAKLIYLISKYNNSKSGCACDFDIEKVK
jgi:L-asparaginase/Glu-tRNA(Gln) amidotransferase subunit D